MSRIDILDVLQQLIVPRPTKQKGLTANMLMLGEEVRLPGKVMFGSTTVEGEIYPIRRLYQSDAGSNASRSRCSPPTPSESISEAERPV